MKRPSEDTTSDSDMGETIDVGSENNYSGRNNGSLIRCGSPTTTSPVMARKKRRGIIEKRRRDRINNSLTELRRLVPTAFEKQGSAKLEKAEILQMTVDHLKMLQATGGKGYFDAHSLAMDFLSIGFRECVTEVARYLSSVEGLEGSDPLRLRLVSHLSSCASQRETSAAIRSSLSHPTPNALHPHWAAAFPPLTGAFLQAALPSTESNTAPSRLPEGPHHRSSSSSSSALLTATFSSLTDSSIRAPSTGCIAPCSPALSTSLLSLSAKVQAAAAAQTFPLSFQGGFPIFHPSISASSLTMTAASPLLPTAPLAPPSPRVAAPVGSPTDLGAQRWGPSDWAESHTSGRDLQSPN